MSSKKKTYRALMAIEDEAFTVRPSRLEYDLIKLKRERPNESQESLEQRAVYYQELGHAMAYGLHEREQELRVLLDRETKEAKQARLRPDEWLEQVKRRNTPAKRKKAMLKVAKGIATADEQLLAHQYYLNKLKDIKEASERIVESVTPKRYAAMDMYLKERAYKGIEKPTQDELMTKWADEFGVDKGSLKREFRKWRNTQTEAQRIKAVDGLLDEYSDQWITENTATEWLQPEGGEV